MANLNRDDWPPSDKPTNKKGTSASNTTQTQRAPTQKDINSAKEKANINSTSKKSGDAMAEDTKVSNPSHKETGIWDDTSRATISQPRGPDHLPKYPRSKPEQKPNGGKGISSPAVGQGHPKKLHGLDEREDDHFFDEADKIEDRYDWDAASKKSRRYP